MSWLYYLLEANLYLAIFYCFYSVLLQKETFYGLNRTYLISSAALSFIIPFFQIGSLNKLFYGGNLDSEYMNRKLIGVKTQSLASLTIENLVMLIYGVISAIFLIKLVISCYKILSIAINARREKTGKVVFIELRNSATAFSFFNLLFINPSSPGKNTILKHEMVHIQQNHSLDILFFELIKIFNWFNPIAWLIQKDIKLVHEYIADDITTNTVVKKHEYAMFLIQNSFGVTPNYLANQIFNQSILKRRINMLNRKRSAGRARLKILLTVPIVGGMLFASTVAFSKDYAMIDLYPEKYSDNLQVVQSARDTIKFPPPIVKKDQVKFPPPIVVKDGKVPPPPPPPPGQKSNYKTNTAKGQVIKFPPPIVERVGIEPKRQTSKDRKINSEPNAPKYREVKFPPPIVTPDRKELPPPPPVEPPKPVQSKADNPG